jgi:hypothetical protein
LVGGHIMYNANDFAQICNIDKRLVYAWVDRGLVTTIDKKLYLFDKEEVNRMKALIDLHIPVVIAAENLEVPYGFLKKWVQENEIKTINLGLDAKTKYFITKADLFLYEERIKNSYNLVKGKKRKKRNLGIELIVYSNGLRLFDFIETKNGPAMVIRTSPPLLQYENGSIQEIKVSDLTEKSLECIDLPYNGQKGFSAFLIPKQQDVNFSDYVVLGKLIYLLGKNNARVFEDKNAYTIICRNSIIPKEDNTFEYLKRYIVEGDISEYEDGVVIGDYVKRITISINYSDYLTIKTIAKNENKNELSLISELLVNQITEYRTK